jgi:hypothetical protein
VLSRISRNKLANCQFLTGVESGCDGSFSCAVSLQFEEANTSLSSPFQDTSCSLVKQVSQSDEILGVKEKPDEKVRFEIIFNRAILA